MSVVNDLRNVLRLVKSNRRPSSAHFRPRLDYAPRRNRKLFRAVAGRGIEARLSAELQVKFQGSDEQPARTTPIRIGRLRLRLRLLRPRLVQAEIGKIPDRVARWSTCLKRIAL